MKKILFSLALFMAPLIGFSQDYEIINGVNVELPYYKSVKSTIGQKVSLHNQNLMASNQLFYSYDGKKYKLIKEQYQTIKSTANYTVEALDTVKKKNQVYLRLREDATNEILCINITNKFDVSMHMVNLHAAEAFEEHIKHNCKYTDIGFKVKYQTEKYTLTLPYSEYDYDDVYIKLEKGQRPTIIILWSKGKYLTIDDTYLEYLEKKDEYLSEEQLQAAIKAEEARYDEIFERLVFNKEKYGVNVAFALMQLEIDKEEKWWIKSEEMFEKIFKEYGDEITAKIILGEVQIGMTSSACWLAWGSADRENKSTYSWGTTEQWVYRDKGAYLYFENDILTAIQD